MTAAALKPNMFNHLFASRPDGMDGSSFTATVISVAFHATIVALAIWASTALTPDQATRIGEEEVPIFIATQQPAPAPAPGPSSPAQTSSTSSTQPSIPVPREIPIGIPDVDPAAPAGEFNTDLPAD